MFLSTRTARRRLLAKAIEQGGYFTAKQAQEVGYDYPHLNYHVSCGNFIRVGHGFYRFAELPPSEHDDLIQLALWSRDRQDEPQAVISYESALVLHDLSDLLPAKTHLTVPPSFRKKAPKGCVLHKARLVSTDIEERQSFRVTTPLRTLLDVTRGEISQEELAKATCQALERGLVRRARLQSAIRANPALERLAVILDGERTRAS